MLTPGMVGSVLFEFCSNSPVFGDTCMVPNGFTASQASLTAQMGEVGFSVAGGQPNNRILLTRAPSNVNAPVSNTYVFDNITNTADVGTSYVRISTFASSNASGNDTDEGGVAYPINRALGVSGEVPPYLEFCVGVNIFTLNCNSATGDTIDFGEFSSQATSSATSQFMAVTNANFGYNVTLNGTTLTSGNNTIPASSGSPSSAGSSQFGLNLRANTVPTVGSDPQGPGTSTISPAYNQINNYRFNAGDTLVGAPSADNVHKFTVSYIVNVSSPQSAGNYAATMFYVCLANF